MLKHAETCWNILKHTELMFELVSHQVFYCGWLRNPDHQLKTVVNIPFYFAWVSTCFNHPVGDAPDFVAQLVAPSEEAASLVLVWPAEHPGHDNPLRFLAPFLDNMFQLGSTLYIHIKKEHICIFIYVIDIECVYNFHLSWRLNRHFLVSRLWLRAGETWQNALFSISSITKRQFYPTATNVSNLMLDSVQCS